MTVRWVRDGLKVVRVDDAAPPWDVTDGGDGVPAVPDSGGDPTFNGDPTDPRALWEYATRLPTFAAHSRRIARRRRREELRAGGQPPSGVTAAQLRYARTLTGLSQRALADHLGLSRGAIGDMEIERRSVNTAVGGWVRQTLREHGG